MLIHSTLGYVGPGPALTFIGSLIGLLVTIFLAVFSLILWPIRVLLRRNREQQSEDPKAEESATPAATATTAVAPTTPESP